MQHLPPGQRTFFIHILLQRNALHQLHHYVFHSVAVADVIDGDNIGIGEHGNRMGFCTEATAKLLIRGHLFPHNLHSNKTVQTIIPRLIDNGHSALADHLQDLVTIIKGLTDIHILLIHKRFLRLSANDSKHRDIVPRATLQRHVHQSAAELFRILTLRGALLHFLITDDVGQAIRA